MADAAYENAMERERYLHAEIEKAKLNLNLMETELRGVQQFMHLWKVFAGQAERAPDDFIAPTNVLTKSSKRPKNSRKEDVAEAARRIILETGEPISRATLYKALIDQGYTLAGADPEMVLSTMLWRMRDRIVRLQKGGYWVPEIDAPQFGWDLQAQKVARDEIGDLLASR